ncbi:hypothetical protein ILUMI_11901 [Ignelater luminosus]|uniref:Uncharacterized protein n=1 Tax=Ignelater luminosus TaxID=2038154 RepID=A0A8K0GCA9_IGNLU|nr:hypothetical protein ILUMI_11901 [Ignelater luminosus]
MSEARKKVMPKEGFSYSQAAAKPPSQVTNIAPSVESLISQITAAKSAPRVVDVSTLLPPGKISRKSTMPAPSESGTPKSNTATNKRKPNKFVSTDHGSAMQSLTRNCQQGKKKKKGWPLGKPRKSSQGGNR